MQTLVSILTFWIYPAFFALIVLEAAYVAWIARKPYAWREAGASLVIMVGYRFAGPMLTLTLLGGLFYGVWTHRLFDIPMDRWWSWVLLFLGVEFSYYWMHRLSHEVRWLWAQHSVHHSPQHLNLTAAYRLGWTSVLAGNFLFFMPLMWLGFHPGLVYLMLGLNLTYQFWLHTEAIGKLPRWFEWTFNTPSHHRVHHATNPDYLDRNYGGVFMVWDRLFGTFAAERADEPCRYGLVKQIDSLNPLRLLFTEWLGIARDLASARSLREAAGYAFGPPGWRPGGDGLTAREIRARAARERAQIAAVPAE